MKFVAYDKSTGDVVSYLEVPSEKHALAQEDDAQGVVKVEAFPDCDCVVEAGKLKNGMSRQKQERKVAQAKRHARAELLQMAKAICSGQDDYEIKAAARKVRAAQDYLASSGKGSKLLESVAASRGITVDALATEWTARALPLPLSVEDAEILREKHSAALNRAATEQDVSDILERAKSEFESARLAHA